MTNFEFIERARKIHGDKYDYSKVNYVNYKTKVCIICPKHGDFWQEPGSHLKGYGCRKCASEVIKEKNTYTSEIFIEKAKQIHGNKYDYSKTDYKGAAKKVCIICPKHGEFWQVASTHLKGSGCKKCGDESESEKKKTITTESLIKRFREIHGDKYDYSRVVFVNWKTSVEIFCKKHGVSFFMLPANHLHGQGCNLCKKEKLSNSLTKKTFLDFLEEARKIHGDKYDYSLAENDYKNRTEKVRIICHKVGKNGKEHGIFEQRACDHINGECGCPKCRESKLERKIANFLIKNNIEFSYQKTFPWLKNKQNLKLDFYLPIQNIAIECQGEQHFMPVKRFGGECTLYKTKERDELKKGLCEMHGIKIIYFSNIKHDDVITSQKDLLNEIIFN